MQASLGLARPEGDLETEKAVVSVHLRELVVGVHLAHVVRHHSRRGNTSRIDNLPTRSDHAVRGHIGDQGSREIEQLAVGCDLGSRNIRIIFGLHQGSKCPIDGQGPADHLGRARINVGVSRRGCCLRGYICVAGEKTQQKVTAAEAAVVVSPRGRILTRFVGLGGNAGLASGWIVAVGGSVGWLDLARRYTSGAPWYVGCWGSWWPIRESVYFICVSVLFWVDALAFGVEGEANENGLTLRIGLTSDSEAGQMGCAAGI